MGLYNVHRLKWTKGWICETCGATNIGQRFGKTTTTQITYSKHYKRQDARNYFGWRKIVQNRTMICRSPNVNKAWSFFLRPNFIHKKYKWMLYKLELGYLEI
jgi:hypothetical protein